MPSELPLPSENLIDTFENSARRHPDRPAVISAERSLSFRELDDFAARFASRLAAWGIGPGDRVALWMQNDPEFLVATYGSWKRGAIVVPLSPMLKQREVEFQLKDCGARVLVCQASIFEAHGAPVVGNTAVEQIVPIDGLIEWLAAAPPNLSHRLPVERGSAAYLVYTSGTTGNPKGAICLHSNIAFNTEVFRTWIPIGPEDRILAMAPLFHITGLVAEISLSALTGAPLILFHRFEPARAIAAIERWQPTFALAAITAYQALMNHPDATRERLASLTKCYTGGAPVAPSVVAEFEARFGHYIHNTYGLTESNSPATITPADRRGPVDPASGALSIGVPIPNLRARIVDVADPYRPVSTGQPGELALQGPMIFPGYWERPRESEAAFHQGWFLTGDVAVLDSDGWIYLVDRKKDMIVASGYKVWPREVEDVLYQHPAIREAAVVGVPDSYRGETVKAVVSLREGREASADEIISFCRERMAAYKYPRQVVFVDEIPKTATGKMLRRELRAQV